MICLRSEKGMAIPLVLVTMVVLALLGTALWQYSASELRNVAFEEDRTQAFYVARSGAETVARYIMLNPSIAEDLLDGTYSTVSGTIDLSHDYLGEVGDMQVTVTDIGDDKIEISGLGMVNGSEDAVSIVLELIKFPAPDAVVVTTGTGHVDFHQNMTVTGSIVAGGPVTLPTGYEEDKYSCTPNYPFPPDYFKRVVVPEKENYTYYWPSKNIKNGETYPIAGNEHHQIDNLTVGNKGELIFDFSSSGENSIAILVVSELDLNNGSEIIIEGIGTVEIYIRNTATMNGPKITYPENAKLNFFLAEGCEVSLNGNVQFDGLFYGPYDTHVKLQSNTSVHGAMIVGTLSGQGGNNKIGASGTALTYYSGFADLEFLPIVNQLHWKP